MTETQSTVSNRGAKQKTYVVYIRDGAARARSKTVSTWKQKAKADEVVEATGGVVVQTFVEPEARPRMNKRQQLTLAVAAAREAGAVLLIGTGEPPMVGEDAFMVEVVNNSDLPFVIADMPQVDRTYMRTLATYAAWKSSARGERMKAVLAAAKERGVRIGSLHPEYGGEAAGKVHAEAADEYAESVREVVVEVMRGGNATLGEIAEELMRRGIKTRMGHAKWYRSAVRNLINRLSK